MRVDSTTNSQTGVTNPQKTWPMMAPGSDLIDVSGRIDDAGTMRAMDDDERVRAEAWNAKRAPSLEDRTGIEAQAPDRTAAELRALSVAVAELQQQVEVLVRRGRIPARDIAEAVAKGRDRAEADRAAGEDGLLARLRVIAPRATPQGAPGRPR